MRRLDYVPSWLDDAHTLLEKLNKCIAKIEDLEISDTQSFNEIRTLLNEVKTTSENALSLAQTNESDISIKDGEITVLQGQVSDLNQGINKTLKFPVSLPATEEIVTILPNGSQGSKPLSEVGGGSTLYKHKFMLKVTGTGTLPNGNSSVTLEKSLLSTRSTPYTTLSQMVHDLTDMYFDDNADMFIIVLPPSFDDPELTENRPPFRAYFGYQQELGTLQNPTFKFVTDTVTEL